MNKELAKQFRKKRRHARIRSKIKGTSQRPRLSVFKSNTGLFLQIIDDLAAKTLISVNSKEIKSKGTKTEQALEAGKAIAKKAIANKITEVVFDKGSYMYHGRVKAVAEGAREAGLKF